MSIRFRVLSLCLLIVSCRVGLTAQRSANANVNYMKLRELMPGDDVISVQNLVLHRDAATFTLRQGRIAFYNEVNGKVTGAVFKGYGHFHLTPPTAEERHNLAILNHEEEFDEDFDRVVFRFTDATAEELHKDSAGKGEQDVAFGSEARELHNFMRTKLRDNLDLRLLEDVLSSAKGGYFLAAIHGNKNSHLIFTLDPYGAGDLAPEEVSLMSWNDWGPSYPTAFRQASNVAFVSGGSNHRNTPYHADNEDLDVSIQKNGFLTGLATVHIVADQDGVTVVPLNLYPTLRVSRVETEKGEALDFVQEKKDEDADFGVVLAQPLKNGESVAVRVAYAGKDVVENEGNANYYPVARENWYPNASVGFGDYTTYQMQFHVPKGLQLIATGTKISEDTDGKITTTKWKTDVPLPVVGFNLGDFKMKEAKVQSKSGGDLTIDAYANTHAPEGFNSGNDLPVANPDLSQQNSAIGNIDTASLLPMQLSQAQVAAQIYTNYFGPLPFSRVAVTQQFACNYGQSWPMLVYLPICGFMDTTQQHFLGLRPEDMYWKIVTPHEVAHQWWGQTVGFHSYRDQWMSEGFADASASIFLQLTRPKPDEFLAFWKEQRKLITEKNAFGFRPINVGPVTMGLRLSTDKTGFDIYRDLVYPKGAYILHMIRMMMWTPKEGDERFKATMHDLVETYRLQAATTEDFKAIVEKHMSQQMDLDGNHKMDWFFNQYVYGTDLPAYHFEGQVTENDTGASLHFKLAQSGVSPAFKMLVPIYLEFTDGKIIRLGSVHITGSETLDQTANLPKLPGKVKRVTINHYYDVLSTED
jgi:hypothetical protein